MNKGYWIPKTRKGISRRYSELLNKVYRDRFGADWPTLAIVNRPLYLKLKCLERRFALLKD